MTEPGSTSCPPRWATPRNPDRPTLGPAVTALAADLGYVLMPHQRQVLDVALELDPATGRPWYRDVGVSAMRQVGKSALVLPVGLHRGLTSATLGWSLRPLIKLVLQNATMARLKLLEDFWPVAKAAPRVRRQMLEPIRSAARPTLRFENGSRWEVGGNTRDSNHSQTIHLAFLDEAFAYGPEGDEQASVRPAMSTIAEAQQWTLSAAGDADSEWWNAYQDQARDVVESGLDARSCYFEWGAADDVDLDDATTWVTFHPGLAHGLITLDTLAADHEQMGAGEFARAHANRRTGARELLFPPRKWEALASDLTPRDHLQFAVDVGYAEVGKPRQSAIAVAGWDDDRPVVEVVAAGDGTAWVVPRLKELIAQHRPVGVSYDDRGPVAALHRELRAAVSEKRRHELGTTEVCGAAEQFHQAVVDGRVWHRGQAELDLAVGGAKRRPVGEAWAYGRKASSSNVTPLVAASLAYRQLVSRGRVLTTML